MADHAVDVDGGDDIIGTIEAHAFYGCERLQRIAISLKRDLFPFDDLF
jgi:hypothetical protein